jgi:hypothetical protein
MPRNAEVIRQWRDTAEHHDMVARLVEATLNHRKAAIRYHSFSSRRTKDYEIEPYRLAYGQGGLYLFAYVPEYGQMRTFAIERIKTLSLSEERFDPGREISGVFDHSIGIHQGEPQRIEIEFASSVAPYIQERLWHPSQKMASASDGSVLLTLNVCADWALESWILSFGPSARVLHPLALAKRILRRSRRPASSTPRGSRSRCPGLPWVWAHSAACRCRVSGARGRPSGARAAGRAGRSTTITREEAYISCRSTGKRSVTVAMPVTSRNCSASIASKTTSMPRRRISGSGTAGSARG